MNGIRRLGSAAIIAGLMAGGMVLGAAPVEAGGKKGTDSQDAICAYLLSVIQYPYVNLYIKAWATSLYLEYGCDPGAL